MWAYKSILIYTQNSCLGLVQIHLFQAAEFKRVNQFKSWIVNQSWFQNWESNVQVACWTGTELAATKPVQSHQGPSMSMGSRQFHLQPHEGGRSSVTAFARALKSPWKKTERPWAKCCISHFQLGLSKCEHVKDGQTKWNAAVAHVIL